MSSQRYLVRGCGVRGSGNIGLLAAVVVVTAAGMGGLWWLQQSKSVAERELLLKRQGELEVEIERLTAQWDSDSESPEGTAMRSRAARGTVAGEPASEDELDRPAVDAERAAAEHLESALAAIEILDGGAFLDAAFGLLDLGPQGFRTLRELLNTVDPEQLSALGQAIDDDFMTQAKLTMGIAPRLGKFKSFCEQVLANSAFDFATEASLSSAARFQIYKDKIPADVLERLSGLIVDPAEAAAGDPDAMNRIRSIQWEVARVLARSGDPAVVGPMEALIAQDPARFALALSWGLEDQPAETAVPILKSLLDSTTDRRGREHLLQTLGNADSESANQELWSQFDTASGSEQTLILASLSQRPGNLDALLSRLSDEGTSDNSRRAILANLNAETPEATRDVLWERFPAERSDTQELILNRLVREGDPRAADHSLRRFLSGDVGHITGSGYLSSDLLARHRLDLYSRAADEDAGPGTRWQAASALARIDKAKGVAALTTGFAHQPIETRRQFVMRLGHNLKSDESMAALRNIAANDSDESIRTLAGQLSE